MKTCCKTNKRDKKCKRKSDNKIFKLPRKFTKQRCKKGIKGFTMRSSCAAYKDCLVGGGLSYKTNMLGKRIKICSKQPLSGYYRDGYCMTGPDDTGTHTVCAEMNKEFLDYTKSKGNDLSSVVKPGNKWCLCEHRWEQSYQDGVAPPVYMDATNMRTNKTIRKHIKNSLKHKKHKTAYFAGGCFWHIQSKFNKLPGVIHTVVGYMGGNTNKPTYEKVSTGNTGHAETVKIIYDPNKISYQSLVNYFMKIHDPTSLNKQGNDIGTQYRSIGFYGNKSEKDILLSKQTKDTVTEIIKQTKFYEAEKYHQNYIDKYI